MVRDSLASFRSRGFGQWLGFLKGEPGLAGFCGLRALAGTPDLEILFGTAPDYWGRGLATEAAQAVLRYGFEHLALPRIMATSDAANVASVRVLEKAGLRRMAPAGPDATRLLRFAIARDGLTPGSSPLVVRWS